MATAETNMPADVAEAHRLLGDELYFLYTKWNYFNAMFCTDEQTIALLHYAAEFVFEIYRELLRDDIILTACRMTDVATTRVKGTPKDNLTLRHLESLIPESAAELRHDMTGDLTDIEAKIAIFRDHRNRRIGHHDLEVRKKRSMALLPKIGLTETTEMLKAISHFLNRIEQFYDHNEQSYHEGQSDSGHVGDLIEFIKDEQSLRKHYEEKEMGT